MKKVLSLLLALALVLACGVSLAEEGKSRTSFWIPKNLAEIEVEDLPLSEFPVVKTKTANGKITVTVSPEPDALAANWMGYGEKPEQVALENGVGVISQEGHKYQLGAAYNKSWKKNWIAGVDYVEEDEASSYDEAVAYFRKNYAEEIADGAMTENEPFYGFYVYFIHNEFYFTGEGENIEVHEIGTPVQKQVTDFFATRPEAETVMEELGTLTVSSS